MKIKEELKKQVDDIFTDLGITNLNEEEKRALEDRIMERLERVVLEVTLASLDDNQLKEFEKAMDDEENTEELVAELTSNVPGLSARVDMALRNEWEGIKKAIAPKS